MHYSAVLTIERRVTRDGMISVAGNHYSVPDSTRRRTVEAQVHPTEVRIFEDGRLIASHPVLEGKNQRRVDPNHRQSPPKASPPTQQPNGLHRPLSFYGDIGDRMAGVAT